MPSKPQTFKATVQLAGCFPEIVRGVTWGTEGKNWIVFRAGESSFTKFARSAVVWYSLEASCD